MESKEFSKIRHYLGKTQGQLARLLSVSPKAIQSFEQGWRNIPPSAERQLLFLLYLKMSAGERVNPCWEILSCPDEWRKKCAAWEFNIGRVCWFVNGTFCRGREQGAWKDKIKLCRRCEAFKAIFPQLGAQYRTNLPEGKLF